MYVYLLFCVVLHLCMYVACQESMWVSQTHDTFLMYADSEKEMDGWIDAIIRVLYEVGVAVSVSVWVGVTLHLHYMEPVGHKGLMCGECEWVECVNWSKV